MVWKMTGKLLFNHSKKESQAICDALNILIWKLSVAENFRTRMKLQNFIIAELADKDIIIYWNCDKEEFTP